MKKEVSALLTLALAACRAEGVPPGASGTSPQPSGSASVPRIEPSLSDAGSASVEHARPAEAPPLPAPLLAPGKLLAWQLEQGGRVVPASNHVAELARAPFTIAVHIWRGASDRVTVNAWRTPETLDGARFGWPYKALRGFQDSTRPDSICGGFDRGKEALLWNNRGRDLYVSELGSNAWFVCAPGSAQCDGFDGPCEATDVGAVCRRSIALFTSYCPDEGKDLRSNHDPTLFLVAVLPAPWSDDERSGKAPMRPEIAREWATVRWTKAD